MVNYKSNMRQVKSRLESAQKNALEAIGRAGANYVKLVTPVDTGALRASIAYRTGKHSVAIGSTLTTEDYPVYVHEGTRKMGDRPYIKDGILLNLSSLENIAKRNFKL